MEEIVEEQIEEIRENKMGTMKIDKLLLSISVPIMISMLIQALYNIIDSMFVAQINENALTAVSLAFPIQALMISVGVGTGVGVNAYLSRSLGEGDREKVNRVANNGVFLAFMSFIVFAIIGLLYSKRFFQSQTTDVEILSYGTTYLLICTTCSFGIFGQFVFERLLQATGKSIYTMITQSTGAIVNIILDPIFIFGLFGFPKMGVAGAAIATIFGQTVAMSLAIYFNIKKNKEIKIELIGFRPDLETIKNIYKIGIPSIIMQSIGSITVFALNKILMTFTPTATAVFGVYFKLQSFVLMPVFGLNNGMIPIIAYNYGAKHKERILKTIKLSIIYAMSIMIVGLVIFQTIPEELLLLFNASEDMIKIGVEALKIISLSFLFAGVSIVLSSVFQALGNGMLSLILAIVRQLVIIVPVAYILSKLLGLNAVWLSFPIAEVIAVIFSILCMRNIYNKVIKDL